MIRSASHHLVNATEEPTEIHSVLSSKRHSPMPGVFFISYESILIITICFQREMGALTSIPLCQRARGAEEGGDTNNNLQEEEDRNITQVTKIKVVIIRIKDTSYTSPLSLPSFQVVEVQPEATSTPKVLRRIEPLPEDRDLGDSSNSDSLESELEVDFPILCLMCIMRSTSQCLGESGE